MSDNYPPGAAHDPRAPYNEPIPTETEVVAKEWLVKETYLTDIPRDLDEREMREAFDDQWRTPKQIIDTCMKICLQLLAEHRTYFAGYNIRDLILDCEGWEYDEFSVEPK